MNRRFVIWFVVGAMTASTCLTAEGQESVATPAIDETVFKEGAVEAREFKFEAWYAKCQQIVKIKKRVCNLLSDLNDGDGRATGSVLIATTDVGIPAMLISLPREVSREQAISVDASYIGKVDGKVIKVEFKNNVNPMICDTSCKYMFPLDPRLVFMLNAGEGISIVSPAQQPDTPKQKKAKSAQSRYVISGHGFAETLSASTQKW